MKSAMLLVVVLLVLLAVSPRSHASGGSSTKQTSYPPCYTQNGQKVVFDIIVLGGGIAGSVSARYSVLAGLKTLLVERGIHYYENPAVATPGLLFQLLQEPSNASVPVTSTVQNVLNSTITFVTPSVLGSFNGMIWARGDVEKFHDEDMPASWNWDTLKNYYKKIETRPGGNPDVRGLDGPVHITTNPSNDTQYPLWKAAYNTVYPNMPERIPDINSFSPESWGFGPAETTVFNGERVNGYTSHIRDIENNPNLTIVVHTEAQKIIFRGKTATGALLWRNDTQDYCIASAKKGVVVSAGAIYTPKLLKLSGLGPKNELKQLGIKVIRNLPAVGQHLDDHPTITETYISPFIGAFDSANIFMCHYWNARDIPNAPLDFTNQWTGFPFTVPGVGSFTVGLSQRARQVSKGSVKLNPSDPTGNPIVDFGYFTDPFGADLETLAIGYEKSQAIASAFGLIPTSRPPPFFQFPACLNSTFGLNCSNPIDKAKAAIAAGGGTVGYHFASTARFGTSKHDGVVNPANMIVFGTKNVAVIDASVLPVSPRGNTQATVYAVATRGIELFLQSL